MRVNNQHAVVGQNIRLVPYCIYHVHTFFNWTRAPDLSPLFDVRSIEPTLEFEYTLQESWVREEDQLMFIALRGNHPSSSLSEEISRMIGEVCLFYPNYVSAEVHIMIADRANRRRGYGREIMSTVMTYAAQAVDIDWFYAEVRHNQRGAAAFFRNCGFQRRAVWRNAENQLHKEMYAINISDVEPRGRTVRYRAFRISPGDEDNS